MHEILCMGELLFLLWFRTKILLPKTIEEIQKLQLPFSLKFPFYLLYVPGSCHSGQNLLSGKALASSFATSYEFLLL